MTGNPSSMSITTYPRKRLMRILAKVVRRKPADIQEWVIIVRARVGDTHNQIIVAGNAYDDPRRTYAMLQAGMDSINKAVRNNN